MASSAEVAVEEFDHQGTMARDAWQAILDNNPRYLIHCLSEFQEAMGRLVNPQGRTPLMWACYLGRDECIRVPNWPELRNRPPYGEYWQDEDGLTAAMWCVLGKKSSNLWQLTERRVRLCEELFVAKDRRGRTVLDIALETGDAACVSIIWERIIDLCVLELPTGVPYSEVAINFKVKFGIDESFVRGVAKKAKRVNYARVLALVFDDHDEVAKTLVALDPKAVAEDGATAMHIAAWTGRLDVLKTLHRRGGDPGALDHMGSPPLFTALNDGPNGGGRGWYVNRFARHGDPKRKHLETVKWLAENFDPMWINKDGRSALATALEHGIDPAVVEYLVPLSNLYGPYANNFKGDIRSILYGRNDARFLKLRTLIEDAMAAKIVPRAYARKDPQGAIFRKAAEQGNLSKLQAMLASEQKKEAQLEMEDCAKRLVLRPDALGRTAILLAAWSGHVECVRLLIPTSNILQHDNGGFTPLMAAASAKVNARECFDLLLQFSHASAQYGGNKRTASDMLALRLATAAPIRSKAGSRASGS